MGSFLPGGIHQLSFFEFSSLHLGCILITELFLHATFCTSFDYITFFRSDRLLSVSLFHEHKACVITLLPTLKRFHSKFVVFINCCAIGSQAKLVRAHPKEFINKKRQSPSWKKMGVKMKW